MKCSACVQDKSEDEFCFRGKAFGRRNTKCKSCVNSYNKQHYQQNKQSYVRKARAFDERVRARQQEIISEFKSKPCADCGKTFPPCAMDFDHLPGTEKKFNIASRLRQACNLEKLKAEIAKCEVVCACCHRIRTFNRFQH